MIQILTGTALLLVVLALFTLFSYKAPHGMKAAGFEAPHFFPNHGEARSFLRQLFAGCVPDFSVSAACAAIFHRCKRVRRCFWFPSGTRLRRFWMLRPDPPNASPAPRPSQAV